MPIPTQAIDDAFAQCTYARDERKAPDEHRRGKFLNGWVDATQREQVYSDDALARLTWKNLGYRLGQRFGALTPAQIDRVFEYLAGTWRQPSTTD